MNNQAAQTMPKLPVAGHRIADLEGDSPDILCYTADQMHQYARDYAAALSQTAGVVEGKRDREADHLRFPDADFNAWLDAGISDAGHTVYDSISSIEDAWQGWHGHVLSVMLDENPDLDAMLAAAPAASGGESAASVSERARELLAAEYERTGCEHGSAYAAQLRAGISVPEIDPTDEVALRAIEAALKLSASNVEPEARALFEAQADPLAASWDRQWEPTKEHWRKVARANFCQALTHHSISGASVSERARALLAAEYRDSGYLYEAGTLEAGVVDSIDDCALRAIEKAFTKPILPSIKTFASAVWRDWMTNEQADRLGAELHAWLGAHVAVPEQAMTQQRGGFSDVGNWLWVQLMDWCRSQRIAPATQDKLFGIVERARKQFPATTPQPSADAVRELVQRWRKAATESVLRDRQRIYLACSDELESLLGRGG